MSMCPAIFISIFSHWVMRLSLESSVGRSRGSFGVLPANFPIVSGKKSHQFLVLRENLLQNIYSSCCSWWFRIFWVGTVYHIFLVLKIRGKEVYSVFNKVFLYVDIFFNGQLSSLGEFLMGFGEMCF